MDRRSHAALALGVCLCLLVSADSASAAGTSGGTTSPAGASAEGQRPCPAAGPSPFDPGCPGRADREPAALPSGESAELSFLRPEVDARPYWRRNLLKRFLGDQKFLAVSWWPAESRHYEFSVPLVIAVLEASGSADGAGGLDLRWERSIEGWSVGERRDVAEGLTRLGDAESAIVLVGSTYLISRWIGNERTERAASLSAEALMNTALHTALLKRLTRRTRPAAGGVGDFFVVHPQGGQETTSFPSGHASGAFAVATVFAWEFRDKRWVPWVAYGTAGLIGLSRVGLGRHFPSDVLAGAVLGHSTGRMVVHRNGGADEMRRGTRLEPLFEPRNNDLGIGYRRTW